MTSRARAQIAFGAWIALAGVTLVFALLNRPLTSDLGSLDSVDFVYVAASTLFAGASAVVGLVVAARTHHPIGWLFLAFAVAILLPLLGEQYAFYGIVTAPRSVPAARQSAAAAFASFSFILPILVLILVLFPTGRPRSRRWRALLVATPIVAIFWAFASAVQPGDVDDTGWHEQGVTVANPFAIHASWVPQLAGIAGTLVIVLFLAAIVSIVVRFRGSRGVERQQIKSLAFVALAAGLIIVAIIVTAGVTGPELENAVGSIGWGLLVTTILLGLPLAIGASILRYRLYDIDRIISRTFSYAIITAILGGTFAFIVLVPPVMLGGDQAPDYVIALATLAVAALFRPVRRRVQSIVDHRFDRKRYDAEHTIETFTARLREQIDIDALGAELLGVVSRTMQPDRVSLWLKEAQR